MRFKRIYGTTARSGRPCSCALAFVGPCISGYDVSLTSLKIGQPKIPMSIFLQLTVTDTKRVYYTHLSISDYRKTASKNIFESF